MKSLIKKLVARLLAPMGYAVISTRAPDLEKEFIRIQRRIAPFTMTSTERQYALFKAIEYVEKAGIDGDIVECGVWKGGSSMLAALSLLESDSKNRGLWLYDTFAGMSEPTEHDVNLHGNPSKEKWRAMNKDGMNGWDYASLEEVRKNVHSTGYPKDKVRFIKGKVEETIPRDMPKKIALLRLDTDWYESTKHELEHLFPLLAKGGVLIIDDYGHWRGARKAVDEYIERNNVKMLLDRIDYTGRIGVKAS